MWDKLWEAIQKYGGSARDARIGVVGADQVRDLYKSDKELAKELNDRYLAANVAGISGGATAASALTAGVVPTLASEAGGAAGYDSKGRPLLTFGGGSFGGGGAGATFGDGIEQVENYDYVRNTPILQSFSDAFNNARKSGLSSFTFNGKEYTTEMSDNPNYVGKKYQPLLNIREVLDKNMKVMSDSTRVEPYLGQIPGTHRRKSSQ